MRIAIAKIAIDHENPSRVRVTVEMGDDVPVRQDSSASMQLQGITGVTFVQISGGTQSSPRIPPSQDYPYPEIRSKPSQIAELVDHRVGGVDVRADQARNRVQRVEQEGRM